MQKQPTAYLLLGMPGSGKSTFEDFLTEAITAKYGARPFISDTGEFFRGALSGSSFLPPINKFNRIRIAERQNSGGLQSSALAIMLWCSHFSSDYTGERFIVMDGSPRRVEELHVQYQYLTEMFEASVHFIHVSVSREVAVARMLERHKTHPRPETESIEAIEYRLAQFDLHNRPVIEAIEKTYSNRYWKLENDLTFECLRQRARLLV